MRVFVFNLFIVIVVFVGFLYRFGGIFFDIIDGIGLILGFWFMDDFFL